MKTSTNIEIQLSKSKIAIRLLGSIIFVVLGFWFVVRPPRISNSFFGNPTLMLIAGLASILLFGLIGFGLFKKLFDKSPGIIISDEGILDNSSGISAGFVPWEDILEIRETKVQRSYFINLVVKNPEYYINRQTNILKRKMTQMNYNTYGTVIGINAGALQCEHNQLKAMITDKFIEIKNKKES